MPAAKRNMGARIARGKYLAFFDDDVEIEALCLSTFQSCMESTKAGMLFGKLHKADEQDRFDEAGGYLTSTGFIWSRAGQNIIDTGQFNEIEPIFAGKSASCIIEARLFHRIGEFDEDFEILAEETDLAWRVWLSGHQVLFCPQAVGIHWFNCKKKDTKVYYTKSRVFRNGCRNYLVLLIKNLEAHNLCRILPIHVLIWLMVDVTMIGTGKFGEGVNIFKGLWYVVRNLPYILRKRRKVQANRVITDEQSWPFIFRAPKWSYYSERLGRYLRTNLHG